MNAFEYVMRKDVRDSVTEIIKAGVRVSKTDPNSLRTTS